MRSLVFRAILIVAFVVSLLSFLAIAYLYAGLANSHPEAMTTSSVNEYFVRLFWSAIGMVVSLLILLWQAATRSQVADVVLFEIGILPIGKDFDDMAAIIGEPADLRYDE